MGIPMPIDNHSHGEVSTEGEIFCQEEKFTCLSADIFDKGVIL
jgi:hypothetical protein